jgi:hypothetical protein
MKKGMFGKKGIVADYLPWIIIAVAILAIILIAISLMGDKGLSLIDKIKDLVRLK